MPHHFLRYELVDGHTHRLDLAPRLASWDAATSAAQLALTGYLGQVETLVGPTTPVTSAALHLSVQHPDPVGIDRGHDLDNYLYPLVRHLGPNRFELARATKSPTGPSQIAVGRAQPPSRADEPPGWRFTSVTTTGSGERPAWKQQIHDHLTAVVTSTGRPPGPVKVELAFRIGPDRTWTNLWKPAIDSLGPIIGEGHRAYAPRDDLIVSLGLHRNVVHDLAHQVELGIWWQAAEYIEPAEPSG